MSSKRSLEELLNLPYNPTRDLEPFFTAFKVYCADSKFRNDSDRNTLSKRVHALYDVLAEKPIKKSELKKMRGFSYPYDSLPESYFQWCESKFSAP